MVLPVLDVNFLPFTCPGSFLRLSRRSKREGGRLILATCSGRAVSRRTEEGWAHDLFEIELESGEPVEAAQVSADHASLWLRARGAEAEFLWLDGETLLIEGRGAALRLWPRQRLSARYTTDDGQGGLAYQARSFYLLRESGRVPRWDGESGSYVVGGVGRYVVGLRVAELDSHWTGPMPEVDGVRARRRAEIDEWMSRMPRVTEDILETGRSAWLLLRDSEVPAAGLLRGRRAVYMSKFSMNRLWSWDNCFNALVFAQADVRLAWDQIHVVFDHQAADGRLPDAVCDAECTYGYTKPPIYGWCLRQMVRRTGLKAALPHLDQLFPRVARLTQWWFRHRDQDGNGLCEYLDGNDSGWDNSTMFDHSFPVEGPDLTAWLILQAECLAWMAQLLGDEARQVRWSQTAERLMGLFLRHHVGVDGEIVSRCGEGRAAQSCRSLLTRMPVMLGRRLPVPVWRRLVEELSPGGPFLGEWGLASEALDSPDYEDDGYWRGSVWAVTNYLIAEGLREAGEVRLAGEIARRFCRLVGHSPGFWENYDAKSGKGLRCAAYSWTAACHLLLGEMLVDGATAQDHAACAGLTQPEVAGV